MSDFNQIIAPPSIHSYGIYGPLWEQRNYLNASFSPGSLTWVANLAYYIPISIPFSYLVNRVFWVNGSTATSNVDFGIFTPSGSKIYSTGSVAQSGGSSPQFVNVSTPFVLSPGRYLFGYMNTGTTTRAYGSSNVTVDSLRLSGVLQEDRTATGTLPSTATFSSAANALFPWCGVTYTTTGT